MYICIFIAINNNVWFLNFSPINILYSTDFHLTKSCRHRFSLQTSKNIINHQIDHFQPGFSCGSSNMRGQNHIWHLDQFMIWSNGFRSHNIKSSSTNFSFLKSLDQIFISIAYTSYTLLKNIKSALNQYYML